MRLPFALFAVALFVFVPGCSRVTERDLVELGDPNPWVGKAAVQRISKEIRFPASLLARFAESRENEAQAVAIMIDILENGRVGKDTELRILKAFGVLAKPEDIPVSFVNKRLKSEDEGIRVRIAELVGKMKYKRAVTSLIQLLEKEELEAQYEVIWALGEIGDQRAIPALNSLLESDDEYEKYNAYKALGKIWTGKEQTAGDSTKAAAGVLGVGQVVLRTYQAVMTRVFEVIRGV